MSIVIIIAGVVCVMNLRIEELTGIVRNYLFSQEACEILGEENVSENNKGLDLGC